MNKWLYDAGMHPHRTSSQTSPQVRSRRPRACSPAVAAYDDLPRTCRELRQLPDPSGVRLGHPIWGTDHDQDLAELRRCWGDAYRIIWYDGRFRATHIVSGQTLHASSAADLRTLIRDHHSRQWANSSLMPGVGYAPSIAAPTSPRGAGM
jgi:hypothetical protein